MIIFINGSINSGKSTVAKILAEKIGKVALVEIDSLREFINWMPINEAIPINLKNALEVIKNFIEVNINVVVPYPLSKKDYEYFKNNLKESGEQIHVFTLSPTLDIALTNRGSRELDDWERDRIKYHYNIGIQKPDFGVIIDNSDESPAETAKSVLSIINKN